MTISPTQQETLQKKEYQFIRTLSEGGFSRTHIVKKYQEDTQYVLKIMNPRYIENDNLSYHKKREYLEKFFQRESAILHKFQEDSQIPRLIDSFRQGDNFYLILEFIEGSLLTEELNVTHISEEYVITLMLALLEIVERLHKKDIIHRDIKPDNIIRRSNDNQLVLIDFGSAKEKGKGDIDLTKQTGVFTPDYAPIELKLRRKPQFNSDIYPVGIIAIEALTGVHPSEFEYDDQDEIAWQSKIKIIPTLKEIIDQMIKQNYRHRYQTAQEVINQLDKLEQELSSDHELNQETLNNINSEKQHKFIPSPTKPINNHQNLARNDLDHLLNHIFSGLLILIVILLIPSFLIKSGVVNLPQYHPIEETE